MWECKNCGYKNNDSSLKCHGENCKAFNPESQRKEKRVLDFCPKCLHNTLWKPSMFHEKYMKANGQMAKRWKKTWKCEECGRHAIMIGPPIKTVEQVASENNAEIC